MAARHSSGDARRNPQRTANIRSRRRPIDGSVARRRAGVWRVACSLGQATMTSRQELVFDVRALTKTYRMGDVAVHALRDLTLSVRRGEFIVLLGPSGSGKSTLLNILGGLDVPTSGSVLYCGADLTHATEAELTAYRRHHIGFVFQFYNLIPSLTAEENVALVTDISTAPMTAVDALDLVELAPRRDHFPAQLSGGEQQRVAIARAIAKRPDVLLCDEPTGALDISTGIVVLEALARVNRELGTTTLVITHNAGIAAMADRVVRLMDGRITGIEEHTEKATAATLSW
jgi:putative ABC transport system ATP-binding protein